MWNTSGHPGVYPSAGSAGCWLSTERPSAGIRWFGAPTAFRLNGTETIGEAGSYPYTSPHDSSPHRIDALFHRPPGSCGPAPGAPETKRRRGSHLHRHGLTGNNRACPGLDQALAAARQGDTLVVPELDRLPTSVPDSRAVADQLRERSVKPAIGRTLYDPGDPIGKPVFNILAPSPSSKPISSACAPTRAWPSAAPGGNCAGISPICPTNNNENSAAGIPPANIPSATPPNSSQSQDQPFIAHSSGVLSRSLRSCPCRKRLHNANPLSTDCAFPVNDRSPNARKPTGPSGSSGNAN